MHGRSALSEVLLLPIPSELIASPPPPDDNAVAGEYA